MGLHIGYKCKCQHNLANSGAVQQTRSQFIPEIGGAIDHRMSGLTAPEISAIVCDVSLL